MRIGVDARELQGRPTGVGRYLRNLLREWSAVPEDQWTLYFNGPAVRDPVLDAAPFTPRSLCPDPVRGLHWQERLLPAAASADALDVFFAPAYACSLRLDLPRVINVHDLSFFHLPQDFPWRDGVRRRLLVGASLTVARRIVTVSDFTRRELLHLRPELAGRVAVITHGPDDDLPPAPAREQARKQLGLSGPLILTVGSILNRRHLPELLHAVGYLARHQPGLVLDVVGENRTHPRLDLDHLVRRLSLQGHVRLSGFVDEAGLAARYAAADVAVCLSEYEGFGLPALEACCRGVPLLIADRPALNEVFPSAALLVDPGDVSGIAAALQRLLADEDLRTSLRARGRALAQHFSWAAAARQTRALLAEAAGT